MCDTCGCNITPGNEHLVHNDGALARTADGRSALTVLKGLLTENDRQAAHNREHFDRHGVLAVNLMSSPGSGKTALLEATIAALGGELRIAVIEGDLETENDADRIRAQGVPAIAGLDTRALARHLSPAELRAAFPDAIWQLVENDVKYEGYIQRQEMMLERTARMEEKEIPAHFDYAAVHGLKLEARHRLTQIRPATLGQAARIQGVTPADIALLAIMLRRG